MLWVLILSFLTGIRQLLFACGISPYSVLLTSCTCKEPISKNINSVTSFAVIQIPSISSHFQMTQTPACVTPICSSITYCLKVKLTHISRARRPFQAQILLQTSHRRFLFSCLFLLIILFLLTVIHLNSTVIFICWADLPLLWLCLLQQVEMSGW